MEGGHGETLTRLVDLGLAPARLKHVLDDVVAAPGNSMIKSGLIDASKTGRHINLPEEIESPI